MKNNYPKYYKSVYPTNKNIWKAISDTHGVLLNYDPRYAEINKPSTSLDKNYFKMSFFIEIREAEAALLL